MNIIDGFIIWIHLLSASIWVGGSIFIGIILAPMLKYIGNSMEERIMIMIKIGRRFNNIAFPSFIILMLTGLYNSRFFFERPHNFIETDYGILLLVKIVLVIITFASYIIHIKSLGKDTEAKIIENRESEYVHIIRSKIINYGRLTVILSILILLFAAFLDAGINFR
jgi:copper resistance protein D